MFNVIVYVTDMIEINEICCSDPKTCFHICSILDKSDKVKCWKLKDNIVDNFGWCRYSWDKYVTEFDRDCFED